MIEMISQLHIPKLKPEDKESYTSYKLRKLTEKMDYVFLYFGIGGYVMLSFHVAMFVFLQRVGELPHIALLSCVVIPVCAKAKYVRMTWLYNTIALVVALVAQILSTATSI